MVGGAAEIDPGGGGAEEGRVRMRREGTGKKVPVGEGRRFGIFSFSFLSLSHAHDFWRGDSPTRLPRPRLLLSILLN